MDVNLSTPQWEFFNLATNDGPPHLALVSGIGAGKSFIGALATAVHVMQCPGSRAFIVAPTETMVRTIAIPVFLEWLPPKSVKRHNQAQKEIELLNGSIIYYRSAQEPDNLRGPNLDWIWCDEAAMIEEEAAKILLGRLRVKRYEKQMRFLCTTTPRGRNWLYNWFVKQASESFRIVKMRTWDNSDNLATEALNTLQTQYTGSWASQELEGEFVSFEGLVYPDWDEDLHLALPKTLEDFRRVACGVDFGWTHHTVFEVVALDWDNGLWTLAEHAEKNMALDEIVAVARQLQIDYHVQDFACDWAAAREMERLVEAGLPASRAIKDVSPGIRIVGATLQPNIVTGQPRLHVTPEAFLLRKQIPGYVFMQRRGSEGQIVDQPKKEADDAPDALRYALMALENYLNNEAERPAPKQEPLTWRKRRPPIFQRIG